MIASEDDAHMPSAAYPESQVATASFWSTHVRVPWRGSTAGPASQPFAVLPSQLKYLPRQRNDSYDEAMRHVLESTGSVTGTDSMYR
jgi:hypothetical protein